MKRHEKKKRNKKKNHQNFFPKQKPNRMKQGEAMRKKRKATDQKLEGRSKSKKNTRQTKQIIRDDTEHTFENTKKCTA